jgi:hypothetical protein
VPISSGHTSASGHVALPTDFSVPGASEEQQAIWGSFVGLYDNGGTTPIATTKVDGNGDWSVGISLTGDGDHRLVANIVDLAGNAGSSGTLDLVLTTPPAAPVTPKKFVANDWNGNGVSDVTFMHNVGDIAIWTTDSSANSRDTQGYYVHVASLWPSSSVWELSYGGFGLVPLHADHNDGIDAIGDFNGDGKADLLVHGLFSEFSSSSSRAGNYIEDISLTGTVDDGLTGSIHLGDPTGNAHPYRLMDNLVVGVGDFNGDGTSDVLWRTSSGTGNLELWSMHGGSAPTVTSNMANPGSDTWVAGVGDFNGDGKADILLENGLGQLTEWFMDGPNRLAGGADGLVSSAISPGFTLAGVGDFNGDGKSDLVFTAPNGGAVSETVLVIWEMNGTTIADGHFIWVTTETSWSKVLATGDYNGDGTADILLQDRSGDLTFLYMKNGAVASYENITNDRFNQHDLVINVNPGQVTADRHMLDGWAVIA